MRVPRFLSTPGPSAAVSIEADCVAVVAAGGRGAIPIVAAQAIEPLPPGAVTPMLTSGNIADRAVVAAALGRAFGRLRLHPRRIGLVVPDVVGKVSLVRLEKVPARASDLDQVIRFQVRKSAPFALEDAQVSYSAGAATGGGGREYVVVVARRDVIAEYEAACAAAGAHAGLVDLATLNVINMLVTGSERPAGDWLLVHVVGQYATIAILRGADLIFFRNRSDEGDENLLNLVHQTTMYYEDRIGGAGFERVVLAGAAGSAADGPAATRAADQVRRALEARLAAPVSFIQPERSARFADRITVAPGVFDTLAPLIGMLSRARRVA
jgi:Tfp pilus assembly PilM family ATPase